VLLLLLTFRLTAGGKDSKSSSLAGIRMVYLILASISILILISILTSISISISISTSIFNLNSFHSPLVTGQTQ